MSTMVISAREFTATAEARSTYPSPCLVMAQASEV